MVSWGKDIRGEAHNQGAVPDAESVALADGLPQKGAGPESVQVAEPNPAIDSGSPEVSGSPIAAGQRRAATLNLDHSLGAGDPRERDRRPGDQARHE
jgi:hypothetical protein